MSEKHSQPLDIPVPVSTRAELEIYNLISSGATAMEIGMQLYKDFSMDRNPEKAYLAIKELLDRGYEGRATLLQMAHGSDELSTKIAEICKIDSISEEEIEKVLGIKRFGDITKDDDNLAMDVYKHMLNSGQTTLDPHTYIDKIIEEHDRIINTPSQMNGTLDQSTITTGYTFAVSEPGYLELFRPKELLKMRTMSQQKMLLLGSLGAYSAREFRKYVDKITDQAETYVIDIDKRCVNMMLDDKKVKNHVVEGDARRMPFKDASMDQVYTNHLFHFVGYEEFKKNPDTDILDIIKEAARVLKPGGYFVISEVPFGKHKESEDAHQMLYELALQAKKFGLEVVESSTLNVTHAIRKEVGSAVIDETGFPHYENSLIAMQRGSAIRVRFVKKS